MDTAQQDNLPRQTAPGPAAPIGDEEGDRLLQSLDSSIRRYPKAEIDEAVRLRERVAPCLLEILKELVATPAKFEDSLLHTYSAALLAHFCEPRAHVPIINAFLLDSQTLDRAWGDVVTETLPALLFQTCGGNVGRIRDLVLNKTADQYVRGSAGGAVSPSSRRW